MTHLIGAPRINVENTSVLIKKVKPGTVRRTIALAAPYKWQLTVLVVVVSFNSAVVMINPLIFREIINSAVFKRNSVHIIWLAVAAGSVSLLEGALGLAQAYISARIGTSLVSSLRSKLFEHIQLMSLAFFTRTQTGALISRLNNDVTGARAAFTDVFSNVIGNLITVILITGALFALSWRITLASLILPLLLVFPTRLWGKRLKTVTREQFSIAASLNNFMVERFNVAGAQLTKLYGRDEDESKLFKENATQAANIDVKAILYSRLFFSAFVLIGSFASALAYGWGGVLVVTKNLDLGTVVAIVSFLARLYLPLVALSNIQLTVMTALVSFERIFELLDLQPSIQEKPRAIPISAGPSRISFHNVSLRYPSASEVSLASLETLVHLDDATGKNVLCDVTFTAEPGQLVALVGPSGAGKTTITQLITRLYDAHCGSITINDVDIRDVKIDSLRKRIGVVTQDAHLFHDTIRRNLLYAKPDATEMEITEALRLAEILSLISSLPEGLDTLVGERGYRFSGGEKQRLAIARLILKGPDIVILDEATSHLDSDSEAAIQEALERVLLGRTSIVIAHRLSTILKADQILVLHDGRIVQRGTHRDLLKVRGQYADLYGRQFASTAS
jgi:ATP-binding cassette subfamily B protein